MKTIIYFLLPLVILFSECHAQTSELTSVISNGETLVKHTLDRKVVQIKITTHEVNIGKASDGWPEKRNNSCTYSRYPCSLVDDIEISVNGKIIFVPRSVFTDISDLNTMVFSTKGKLFTLILKGGDASESYTVEITFDKNRVLKRRCFDAFDPNEVVQETNYYLPTPIE